MKKIVSLAITTSLVVLMSGCAQKGVDATKVESYSKIDVKKECNVETNGIEKVLATATSFNKVAVEHKVEFMRLGTKTSKLIELVNDSLKKGTKTVDLFDADKKKVGTITNEYGAWRACTFAISALAQEEEAKQTWKTASPSDGYKY